MAVPVRFRALLPLALALVAPAHAAVDYLRDVKPVLTHHCVRCHGADRQEADLRLDTADGAHVGGLSGPAIKVGKRENSLLLAVVTGRHDDIPRMPYKKPPLDDAEIEALRLWVGEGAPTPEREEPGRYEHWAFKRVVRPETPETGNSRWARNPIDSFVLQRLQREGIEPSPEAARATLLRRVSLDLTGLPPGLAEIDAYLSDPAPGAYERAVDRLLASPHYGERWARHWLDLARYSDSNGYSVDAPRKMWKYRDWVIDAINRDLPFDQFVVEQLAGDLLPSPTLEQRIATGFNRNTPINQEGGIDPEQFRVESVLDRVNTFGSVFLGLTVGCAQCHDHKFDPISQREYFQIYAYFNNTLPDGHGENRPMVALYFPDGQGPIDDLPDRAAAARAALVKYFQVHGDEVELWRRQLSPEARTQLEPNSLRAAVDVTWQRMTFGQRRAVCAVARPDDAEFKALDDEYDRLDKRLMAAVSTLVMSELPEPRETHLFIKGDFTRPGERVRPGTFSALPSFSTAAPDRLGLARWTVDPGNPLTARVLVNRVWQHYFGRGLVETENDFGTQGALPTHPELLDWLASELMSRGWSLKAIHRAIVISATYRQSSYARPELDRIDPLNRLLARQSRLRLDAEIIRDVGLAASGMLSPAIGGPPVFPPQPDGVMALGQMNRSWSPSEGEDRRRRGLYTHFWRATPHPALAVFDAADGLNACTRRLRSNTPLQALTLLNDRQFHEFAVALAERVETESGLEFSKGLERAFKLCLARPPEPRERAPLERLFAAEQAAAVGDEAARRREAWIAVARVMLNLDETIVRE